MTEILTEQEMSALLSEKSADGGGTTAGGRRFRSFSFSAPPPLPAEALDRLTAAAGRLAETTRARLATELRRDLTAAVAEIETMPDDRAAALFAGGVHLRFESGEGRRIADLALDTEIALTIVEARLGGSIAEPQPRRPLTPVEMKLLARLLGACAGPAIADEFVPRAGGAGAGTRLECSPGDGAVEKGAGFVSIPVQLSIEGRGGLATVLLPAARAAECAAPAAGRANTRRAGRKIPSATLQKLPVRIMPRIPGGPISIHDLMEIRPGMIVRLDQREDEPIEILCNGQPVMRGRLMRSGHATALEVGGWIEFDPTDEEGRR